MAWEPLWLLLKYLGGAGGAVHWPPHASRCGLSDAGSTQVAGSGARLASQSNNPPCEWQTYPALLR